MLEMIFYHRHSDLNYLLYNIEDNQYGRLFSNSQHLRVLRIHYNTWVWLFLLPDTNRVADTVTDTFNGGCVLRNYLSAWSLLTLSMCCCYIFLSYKFFYLFPEWYPLGLIRNNAISTLFHVSTPRTYSRF